MASRISVPKILIKPHLTKLNKYSNTKLNHLKELLNKNNSFPCYLLPLFDNDLRITTYAHGSKLLKMKALILIIKYHPLIINSPLLVRHSVLTNFGNLVVIVSLFRLSENYENLYRLKKLSNSLNPLANSINLLFCKN